MKITAGDAVIMLNDSAVQGFIVFTRLACIVGLVCMGIYLRREWTKYKKERGIV